MINFHHKTSQEVPHPKNRGHFLKAKDIQILVHPAVPPEILQKEFGSFSNFTHVTKIIKHFFLAKHRISSPVAPTESGYEDHGDILGIHVEPVGLNQWKYCSKFSEKKLGIKVPRKTSIHR